jgi:hypothetical protein
VALKSSVNKEKFYFSKNYLKSWPKHLSNIESDDRRDGEQSRESWHRFWQKTGILVTVIFTGFSLNKLKAGKNDTSEVWTTPVAKNIHKSRHGSGKFAKKRFDRW